ncbi:hypothetical protein JTB14_028101 [Gonioctena quinquepunctata]|nr:hypothetical protein JTB14_028101 [Gonioctena quinquepunctata]
MVPSTVQELYEALNSFKDSSRGPGDIPFMFPQKLPDNAKQLLLTIYNRIWTEGEFPEIWSEATTIPLIKHSKPKTDPQSYRPIALTCTACKLLEKIINKRLTWHLEKNKLITSKQSG